MSSPGSAQPIDYYRALGLDTRSPSHALLAQLAHRIAQTPPGPQRHLMEQARAVLGDSEKKRAYDARLRDPQAAPWTPDELHELALAQTDRPAGNSIADKFTAVPRRVLVTVAGALAIVLVAVVTLASCTGGSADTSTATGDSPSARSASTDCQKVSVDDARGAAWNLQAQPDYALVLTDAYPLPKAMASQVARFQTSEGDPGTALTPLTDGGVRVGFNQDPGYADPTVLKRTIVSDLDHPGYRSAIYSADGELISTDQTTLQKAPKGSGLRPKSSYSSSYGIFRIAAVDGVTIPEAAATRDTDHEHLPNKLRDEYEPQANTDNGDYVLDVLIDDEENVLWLLLRGGTDLYKGRVVEAPGDPAGCL